MSRTETDLGQSDGPLPAAVEAPVALVPVAEKRNLCVLALHHILLRIAWIFKTESVIMPAFVDSISGAGWVRGCLPVLNRLGQGVPPLLLAHRVRLARRKKLVLLACTVSMGVPFLVLAAMNRQMGEQSRWWAIPGFLLLYVVFFTFSGLNRLAFDTLQGKLIRPQRRGRLLSLYGLGGSIASIACAVMLLGRWLSQPGGFSHVFLFAGSGFVVAGLCAAWLLEPADSIRADGSDLPHPFREAANVLRGDGAFRRAAVLAMLLISVQLLFPHFQALGREHLDIAAAGTHLMVWVVAQNAGFGIFSLIFGALADRFGNRLSLRVGACLLATVPPLALLLAGPLRNTAHRAYWLTFFLLSLTPVTIKTLANYTLELAEPADHPRYISTMNFCLAVPLLLSPGVGLLVDVAGFGPTFLAITGCLLSAAWLTFRIREPRHEGRRPLRRTEEPALAPDLP